MRKRVLIVDDRGRQVPLRLEGAAFDRGNIQDRQDWWELQRELFKFSSQHFGVRWTWWYVLAAVVGVGMCLWSLPHLFQQIFQRSLFASWGWTQTAVVVVFVVALAWQGMFKPWRMDTLGAGSSFAKTMIARRRCPACLHNLRGRTPDLDGCTVCSECGAAWRLADATCPTDQS